MQRRSNGENGIVVCGIAHNGEDAIRLALETRPDVMLMDLEMPILDGVAATRRIRRDQGSGEVVVLTNFDDSAHLFDALQAGAKGYLLKSAVPEEIAQAVRDVAQGHAALPPALAVRVLAEFCRLQEEPSDLRRLFSLLTRQETEVLTRIAQHKTNRRIGEELSVELGTVKKHVSSVLKKLEANNRAEAGEIARRSGLVSATEPQEGRPRSPTR